MPNNSYPAIYQGNNKSTEIKDSKECKGEPKRVRKEEDCYKKILTSEMLSGLLNRPIRENNRKELIGLTQNIMPLESLSHRKECDFFRSNNKKMLGF